MTTVDPHQRAAAARHLLDAVVALDLEDHGTEQADSRVELALEPLGLADTPETQAMVAATLDLLWFLTRKQAEGAGISQEALISNLRQHVLPQVYPEAQT